MSPALRNPAQLLAFSALCVIGAVTLLLTGHDAPGWLQTLCAAGLVGGAGVMTPGLPTVERLLGIQQATQPTATPAAAPSSSSPPTVGLSPDDVEVIG